MTTLYTVLIAAAVLAVCGLISQIAADRAGVPDYGFNLNMKMGWWWLHFLTLIPAALAAAWIGGIILVALVMR